jgi:hypothetical protein
VSENIFIDAELKIELGNFWGIELEVDGMVKTFMEFADRISESPPTH